LKVEARIELTTRVFQMSAKYWVDICILLDSFWAELLQQRNEAGPQHGKCFRKCIVQTQASAQWQDPLGEGESETFSIFAL
jgi:hypothetical protein